MQPLTPSALIPAPGRALHARARPMRLVVMAALALAHGLAIWALLAPVVRTHEVRPAALTVHLVSARPQDQAVPPLADMRPLPLTVPSIPAPSVLEPPRVEIATMAAVVSAQGAEPAPAAIAPTPPTAPAPTPATAPAPVAAPRSVAITDVQYLVPPAPEYPLISRRTREKGVVELRVLVDAQGRPQQVLLHRSSGHPRLDQAATDSLGAARFKPYTENGQPRPFWVVVPIEYE